MIIIWVYDDTILRVTYNSMRVIHGCVSTMVQTLWHRRFGYDVLILMWQRAAISVYCTSTGLDGKSFSDGPAAVVGGDCIFTFVPSTACSLVHACSAKVDELKSAAATALLCSFIRCSSLCPLWPMYGSQTGDEWNLIYYIT